MTNWTPLSILFSCKDLFLFYYFCQTFVRHKMYLKTKHFNPFNTEDYSLGKEFAAEGRKNIRSFKSIQQWKGNKMFPYQSPFVWWYIQSFLLCYTNAVTYLFITITSIFFVCMCVCCVRACVRYVCVVGWGVGGCCGCCGVCEQIYAMTMLWMRRMIVQSWKGGYDCIFFLINVKYNICL